MAIVLSSRRPQHRAQPDPRAAHRHQGLGHRHARLLLRRRARARLRPAARLLPVALPLATIAARGRRRRSPCTSRVVHLYPGHRLLTVGVRVAAGAPIYVVIMVAHRRRRARDMVRKALDRCAGWCKIREPAHERRRARSSTRSRRGVLVAPGLALARRDPAQARRHRPHLPPHPRRRTAAGRACPSSASTSQMRWLREHCDPIAADDARRARRARRAARAPPCSSPSTTATATTTTSPTRCSSRSASPRSSSSSPRSSTRAA